MRFPLPSLPLAFLLATSTARAGDASRGLVVQLSSAAVGEAGGDGRTAAPLSSGALPAELSTRFASLGLRATRALTDGLSARGAAGRRGALGVQFPELYDFHPERIVLLEAPDPALAASALLALASDPLVDWAERNVTRSAMLVGYGTGVAPEVVATLDTLPSDPHLRDGRQWALRNPGAPSPFGGIAGADVHALAAWRTSVGGNAIKLAVADTGIDPAQPELGGLMPDASPRIVDERNVTDDPDPSVLDLYGHGTPVAGVMAARTNDGAHFAPTSGVAGVCGGDGAGNAGCRIVPIKIAPGHSGESTSFDIARAFLHAADVGASAMNLSFAGGAPSRVERLALTYALYNGCIPVCAAGNSGFDFPDLPIYPAAFARDGLAISVGATDSFDRRAPFSSYPSSLDLVAPGLDVYTTFMTYPSYFGASYPGYVPASGTSFAAPHVTGAVGLLAAVRPELSDTDFQHVIRESADDIAAPGRDPPTAHGRLNLERMLDRVRPEIGIWHDEIAADSFTVEGEGYLTVEERGGGTLARHFGTSWSTRLAAYGTASIPDSFLTVTGVWLRVAGTMAARGDFRIPYFAPGANVLRADAASATFRGYVYRVSEDSCDVCDDRYVPLAPSNVRFAFTVLGVVDRPPTLVISSVRPSGEGVPGDPFQVRYEVSDPDSVTHVTFDFEGEDGTFVRLGEWRPEVPGAPMTIPCLGPAATAGRLVITAYDELGHQDQAAVTVPYVIRGGPCSAPLAKFSATPSPFRSSLSVFAPGAGEVHVLDVGGRTVRRIETSGGAVQWDGCDERGTAARAGIYWVRFTGTAGDVTRKVVKLGG